MIKSTPLLQRIYSNFSTQRCSFPLSTIAVSSSFSSSSSLLITARRFEHRTPAAWILPSSCYTTIASLGSGPGGQAVQKNKNKIELRVDLEKLLQECHDVDHATIQVLQEQKKNFITSDGTTLIIRSHEHRSAAENVEECKRRAQQWIHEASWEQPPVEDISMLGTPLKDKPKFVEKKKKIQYFRKARTAAKAEKFSTGRW